MSRYVKGTCKFHKDEECIIFCETCTLKICIVCFEEEHRSHQWKSLSALSRNYVDKCEAILNTNIPKFQQAIHNFRMSKGQFSKDHSDNKERVEICRDKIIAATKTITDKIMSSLDNKHQYELDQLDKRISSLEADVDHLEDLAIKLKHSSSSSFASDVIQLETDLSEKLNQMNKGETGNMVKVWTFVPGEVNTQILEIMLGQILNSETKTKEERRVVITDAEHRPSTIKVNLISSFYYSDTRLLGIYPSDETKVWVHKSKSSVNGLVTSEGHCIQNFKTGIMFADCVEESDGDFVVTDFSGHKIYRIKSSGEKSLVTSTEPLHPLGISLTLSGDLLITMIDDFNYHISGNSKRLVRHMSLAGQIKQTYQFDHFNEALFTIPYRVGQNYNMDICVVDQTTSNSGQLCLLQEDGSVKCRYMGQNQQRKFTPLDISFDLNCNIFVSDFNSHAIHLLDHTGEFIKYLVDDHLHGPRCLCLYNKTLWVGCNDGKVCVFNYEF